MRQSINQNRKIDALSQGVHKNPVQEEGTFTVISNTEFQAFSVRQLFVVEWQMPRVDSKQFNEKVVQNGVLST